MVATILEQNGRREEAYREQTVEQNPLLQREKGPEKPRYDEVLTKTKEGALTPTPSIRGALPLPEGGGFSVFHATYSRPPITSPSHFSLHNSHFFFPCCILLTTDYPLPTTPLPSPYSSFRLSVFDVSPIVRCQLSVESCQFSHEIFRSVSETHSSETRIAFSGSRLPRRSGHSISTSPSGSEVHSSKPSFRSSSGSSSRYASI